jgi:glycosyltransferase involved in cell wall biosynthesis
VAMKVLVVTESYWPNADGAALFERRLVLGEIGLGHDMTVWAAGKSWQSNRETDGPYTIWREKAARFWFNRKYMVSYWPWWSARRIIRQTRPDVIHIHNCYFMGLAAMYWARHYHIPVVATNHFMPENALLNLRGVEGLYRTLERLIWSFLVWFHNRASYVTSPTPTAVKLLVDHGLKVPASAISNGIDLAVFRPGLDTTSVVAKYNLATDRPIVLYVGRVDGEKRLDVIIAALPALLAKQPVQVVIAGYGIAMDSLREQAERLGVAEAVKFTGYIDEADKPALYNSADVFAIASPAELQSIVTLEAMASGLPIVAVDVAALCELCHDGDNGYLFPRDDSQALADKVSRLISDEGLRKQFGAESIRIVHEHHGTEVMFSEYEMAYKRAYHKRNE